ncbi:MAG: DedA family protein [Candidatus Thermochlorobacter sp.]
MEGLQQVASLDELIRWGGYMILFAIVFAETGLFFGFLLPGDSLLITAGLVAASGKLGFWEVNSTMITAAILGDSTGYFIGKALGRKLFEREDSLIFRREYLQRTQTFYDKHGGKTIFFARFVPIIRSFATTVAGIAGMAYPRFIAFSVSGATTWIVSLTSLGYFLGSQFPELDTYINLIISITVGAIILSIIFKLIRAKIELHRTKSAKLPNPD